MGMAVSSLQTTTQCEERQLLNWYHHSVHARKIDVTLIVFINEAWFYPGGYVNSQSNQYRCAENSMFIHEVSLHEDEVSVLWVQLVCFVTFIFWGHKFTHMLCTLVTPFLKHLSGNENLCSFSVWWCNITTNNFVHYLQSVLADGCSHGIAASSAWLASM
jgi:hypothetical protein